WLRRILIHNMGHVVQRHVLAAKRDVRREVSLDDVGLTMEQSTARLAAVLADVGPTPSDNALRHEAGLVLADELESLPREYREVIVLRHLEGLSFSEVGDRMNRSAGASRMLWMRAIASLRTRFEARGVM
ncbi:MAG: sigma-70 family RNA polymerase sigma factor, partial [Planctomycetota bacterium]